MGQNGWLQMLLIQTIRFIVWACSVGKEVTVEMGPEILLAQSQYFQWSVSRSHSPMD